MMKGMKSKKYGVYVFAAVIVFICIFVGRMIYVHSAGEEASKIDESFYQQMEKTYLSEVKDQLLDCGYANSGVTMTRMSLEKGERIYKVEIYNRLLDGKEDRQNRVREAIRTIVFGDQACDFEIVFLSMKEE